MTKPENGLPALCTSMLPKAISVFPAPHSATTVTLVIRWPQLTA